MENKENVSYIIETLGQMQQTLTTLTQNQTLLFEQYKALDKKIDDTYLKLDKKIDSNYSKLDKKIDSNYSKLDKKIDDTYSKLDTKIDNNYAKITKNYEAIQQNYAAIIGVKKDVKDLRTDVDIVYDLEKDSRKQIRQLL